MEVAERDKAKLVETPGFYSEFPKVIAGEREDLIVKVKLLCEQRAFRVILPYTDRNSGIMRSTTFCCSLSGASNRKKSTLCPFRIIYRKDSASPTYQLSEFFCAHNHSLECDANMTIDKAIGYQGANACTASTVVSSLRKGETDLLINNFKDDGGYFKNEEGQIP